MTLQEIERASMRMRDAVHHVPISSSHNFSEMTGSELYLKCENLQKTGSFKVRGAYNKIACLLENGMRPPSVVASSAGNHAQGVAYAATAAGIPSTIVMPRSAPLAKVSATEGYGAKVVLYGDCYDDAYQKALEICEESGSVFMHPFDDEDIIAGQGTVALEILRDLPAVDIVFIPAGGGGLLSGMAACIKNINPRIQVVGVQSEGADSIVRSFGKECPVVVDNVHTIADGIAVKAPGVLTCNLINEYVDQMVTVSDDEIAAAILLLLERTKMVVEPAGAASLAAILNNRVNVQGKKVISVLSGGNIDVSFIHRIVEKGLVNRGREIKFRAVMLDKPGSLERVSGIVGGCGANIVRVQHDRLDASLRLDEAILHVTCEVSGFEHGQEMIHALRQAGYEVETE